MQEEEWNIESMADHAEDADGKGRIWMEVEL
jgi:hypothetical protein